MVDLSFAGNIIRETLSQLGFHRVHDIIWSPLGDDSRFVRLFVLAETPAKEDPPAVPRAPRVVEADDGARALLLTLCHLLGKAAELKRGGGDPEDTARWVDAAQAAARAVLAATGSLTPGRDGVAGLDELADRLGEDHSDVAEHLDACREPAPTDRELTWPLIRFTIVLCSAALAAAGLAAPLAALATGQEVAEMMLEDAIKTTITVMGAEVTVAYVDWVHEPPDKGLPPDTQARLDPPDVDLTGGSGQQMPRRDNDNRPRGMPDMGPDGLVS